MAVMDESHFYPWICHSIYVNKGMLTSMIICVNIPNRMVPLFNYILKLYLALICFHCHIRCYSWIICRHNDLDEMHVLTRNLCLHTFALWPSKEFSPSSCVSVCESECEWDCVWLCGRALCWCCSWLNNWNTVPACCGRSYSASNT